jgi:hypothetical protein
LRRIKSKRFNEAPSHYEGELWRLNEVFVTDV